MDGMSSRTFPINKKDRDLFFHDSCDAYDYMLAAGCGGLAGLVDVFLVGAPGDSKLLVWTDAMTDKAVMAFAKLCGWKPNGKAKSDVASAIGFLERKFKVNYDQRFSADLGIDISMSAKNHHMKSLAHSPDIIGLFFSILNQFTSTSSFVSDGSIITVDTETNELQGGSFIAKLFCGTINWFGHLMSDVAGSSGRRGHDNGNRGAGIVIPFYELFGLCNFGDFKMGTGRGTLADVATKAFEYGYDFRFGMAMAVPAVLCNMLISFLWMIKRHFYKGEPWSGCIPNMMHDDLRVMLIIGNAALCLTDITDAAIRGASKENAVEFFMRLNLIAWYRLIKLSFREVCIRLGIASDVEVQLCCYQRINAELEAYMAELSKIDKDQFQREVERNKLFDDALDKAVAEGALCELLLKDFERNGIELPWQGDFSSFMGDPNNRLVFR